MASTYLTQSGTAGGSTTKFTKSFWIKRSGLATPVNYIFDNSGVAEVLAQFDSNDKFIFAIFDSGTYSTELQSTQVFRDCSGWYNFVIAVDYTNVTQAHRARVYVNGIEITAWDIETRPSNTTTTFDTWNSSKTLYIGSTSSGTNNFDGIMSYVIHVDGTQYAPTVFGETDTDTGEWKIITSPSITYGTKGFLILKNGNTITDQSTNSNDWTLGGGTLTDTKDCPDNVFATLNSLDNYYAGGTFANGNNTVTTINTGYTYNTSTFGVATGKWYWECKWSAQPTGSSDQVQIGIAKRPAPSSTTWLGQQLYTYGYQGSSGHVQNNNVNASGSVATPYSVGDIISVAMDLDNNKIHFAKNGAWTNSSDPAANSGGVTITAPDSTPEDSGVYFAAFGDANNSLQETGQFNFGNGFFGTSAVTSAGTAGSTPGTFEYDVPSGYEPLTTKGLNA